MVVMTSSSTNLLNGEASASISNTLPGFSYNRPGMNLIAKAEIFEAGSHDEAYFSLGTLSTSLVNLIISTSASYSTTSCNCALKLLHYSHSGYVNSIALCIYISILKYNYRI